MIYNENGLSGKNIIIKPVALWENTNYDKKKWLTFIIHLPVMKVIKFQN